MRIAEQIYKELRSNYDHSPVYVEELVQESCPYRTYLRVKGEKGENWNARKILLARGAQNYRVRVRRYFEEAFEDRFQKGHLLSGLISLDIFGFLDDALVEVAIVSDAKYNEVRPPTSALVTLAVKAGETQVDKAYLILCNQNSQAWCCWEVTGDFKSTAEPVLEDVAYVSGLVEGGKIPVGMATALMCKRCPFKSTCEVEKLPPPSPHKAPHLKYARSSKILKEVNDYLTSLNTKKSKREKPRATNCIHPSEFSIRSCDRIIGYGLMGTEERPNISPKLRRIFDTGHALHDVVQEAMRGCLEDFEDEVKVHDEALRIRGHCDGVTKPKGYEIKSIGMNGAAKLTSPKAAHRRQATLYGKILGLDSIIYLYINKETGEIEEFEKDLEQDMWTKMATRAQNIVNTVEEGKLPPRPESTSECGECKYQWVCKPSMKSGKKPSFRRYGK